MPRMGISLGPRCVNARNSESPSKALGDIGRRIDRNISEKLVSVCKKGHGFGSFAPRITRHGKQSCGVRLLVSQRQLRDHVGDRCPEGIGRNDLGVAPQR